MLKSLGIQIDKVFPIAVVCAACFFVGRIAGTVLELEKRIDNEHPKIEKLEQNTGNFEEKLNNIQNQLNDLCTNIKKNFENIQKEQKDLHEELLNEIRKHQDSTKTNQPVK